MADEAEIKAIVTFVTMFNQAFEGWHASTNLKGHERLEIIIRRKG